MNLLTRKTATVATLAALGLTAGGVAWAEASSSPASSSPSASSAAAVTDHMGKLRGLGRHVLHGEFVVQTRNGFATIDVARGTVSAIDAHSISITSADGVVTTFTIGPNTKARSAGKIVALSAVHKGDKVGVLGMKTGSAAPVARLIRELPASASQGATQDGAG